MNSPSSSPIHEDVIINKETTTTPKTNTTTSKGGLLPTPVSPISTSHPHFGSLISQFSIKKETTHNQGGGGKDSALIKTYPCPDCHQVFHRAHNLKSHRATHSASKPFQCTDCEKQFLRQHDLKRHKKLHTGERPYHCPVCKRSFSRLDALNRHRKTEGGSACLKTNSPSSPTPNKKQPLDTISPLFIPSMTSQWQVLPSPSAMLASSSSNTTTNSSNNTTNTTNTTTKPMIHTSTSTTSARSPSLLPQQQQQQTTTTIIHHHNSSPPLLPSLILPIHEQSKSQAGENDVLVDSLKQRIHDLEIENRVLRSLLCNNNEKSSSSPPLTKKKLMMIEEDNLELLKRQKRSP